MTKSFGELLRDMRQSKDRSMGDLARTLGVSVAFLSDVEHDRRPPFPRERIEQAASFLQHDPTPLLVAAARRKGHVALTTTTDRHREAAAALARGWSTYTDNELDELRSFLESMRRRKDGEP